MSLQTTDFAKLLLVAGLLEIGAPHYPEKCSGLRLHKNYITTFCLKAFAKSFEIIESIAIFLGGAQSAKNEEILKLLTISHLSRIVSNSPLHPISHKKIGSCEVSPLFVYWLDSPHLILFGILGFRRWPPVTDLVRAKTGVTRRLRVQLDKKVPAQAGLGGDRPPAEPGPRVTPLVNIVKHTLHPNTSAPRNREDRARWISSARVLPSL